MDLFILKTDREKFTSTNKKTLHLIFKPIPASNVCESPHSYLLGSWDVTMSSKLQLDVRHHIQCKRHLVNAYEERQAWCNLQVKLCDPCLSTLRLNAV